jgi:leucyl-tRNA synthetase
VDEAGLKKEVTSLGTGQEVKHAMAFIQGMKRDLVQRQPGTSMESILDRSLVFDEFEILDVAIPYIKRSTGIREIVVVKLSIGPNGTFECRTKHGEVVEPLVFVDKTVPGQPSYGFENI